MNRSHKFVLALGVTLASGVVGAQSSDTVRPQYEIPSGKASADGPLGMQVGEGLYVFPYVKLGVGRDDNLFITSTNEKDSAVSLLAPGLALEMRRPTSLFRFSWDAQAARYHSSKEDSYVDHQLRGSGEFAFTTRAGLRLGLLTERGHDARGLTDRDVSNRPDHFRNDGGNALFAFGGNAAKGRVEIEAGTYRKHYDNNRAITQFADRDSDNVRGAFYWRVMPKTSLLIEASQNEYDYSAQTSTLDSKERRYMGGVTWEATAATTGTVKIGKLKKEFQSAVRQNFSATNWEIAVQWAPRTYSKFDFFTQKTTNESTGIGDFILTKRSGIAWTHGWNSVFSTTANYTYSDDEYRGVGVTRNDDTDALGFKLNYKMRRWLTLGADYIYTDRDSNQPQYRYKRNQLMFTLGATL